MEWFSGQLFRALAPRLPRVEMPRPPRALEPYELLTIPRKGRGGSLGGTWFPAANAGSGEVRGAVLMMPPWMEWGRSYFHRRGRIVALREAGYHVLTADFSGFGASSPPQGFFDRDVADALAELRRRGAGLPLHFWGVSSGGHWAHPVLSREEGVLGAFFEDVSPHLIEWSRNTQPLGLPFYKIFQHVTRSSYRFMDMRRHAPHLRVQAKAYVSGEDDRGVRPDDTRALARLAGGECLIVEGADHLGSIRTANQQIIDLALDTFRRGGGA